MMSGWAENLLLLLVEYNGGICQVQEDEFTIKGICLHFYFSLMLSVRAFHRSVIQNELTRLKNLILNFLSAFQEKLSSLG